MCLVTQIHAHRRYGHFASTIYTKIHVLPTTDSKHRNSVGAMTEILDNHGHSTVSENQSCCNSQVVREETPALQYLLGLGSDTSIFKANRHPMVLIDSEGIKDVLFLSINIKGNICGPNLPDKFHIGLSILDTSQLRTHVLRRM